MSTSIYLMEPPTGETRSGNPEDIGGQVVAAGIATTVIAFVVLAARIFTRAVLVRSVGLDDYFAILAMSSSIAFCITTLNGVNLGAGKHMWYMLTANYSPSFLAGNIGITITYSLSVSFSKLSILIFYLRLSPKVTFRRIVYGLIGVVCAYTIAYELIMIFQCTPVAAAWDITITGFCIKPLIPMMVLSSANIVIDFTILLIPVKVFLELQMSKRQRLSLIGLFGAGGFVCAVAIQRTVILPALLKSTDYTWDVVPQMIWGFLEVNTGVVCAALPALKPLFTRYLPHLLSSGRGQDYYVSGSNPAAGTGGNGTGPYSTTIDRNRKRRHNGTGDVPSELNEVSGKHLGSDDEIHLWPMTNSHNKGGKRPGGKGLGFGEPPVDDISINSLEEVYGNSQTRTTISVNAAGAGMPMHSQGMGAAKGLKSPSGIVVTKETRIAGE